MSVEMAKLLSKYADKLSWLIQEFVLYLEEKQLFDDFSTWLAERNKQRREGDLKTK